MLIYEAITGTMWMVSLTNLGHRFFLELEMGTIMERHFGNVSE